MNMTKKVSISKFKAECLAMLDEVSSTGAELVITKRGKPLAQVTSIEPPAPLCGSVRYKSEEDLLSPVDEVWEVER